MIAVSVQIAPSFEVVDRELLFDQQFYVGNAVRTHYDITPDGQRFLMIGVGDTGEEGGPRINVILNWFEELKRLVPIGQ